MKKFKRAFIIVLDSYGIGQEPDAADFGDGICNTLKSIAASREYDTPNMRNMGLFNIDGVDCGIRMTGYADGEEGIYCCVLTDAEFNALENGATAELAPTDPAAVIDAGFATAFGDPSH